MAFCHALCKPSTATADVHHVNAAVRIISEQAHSLFAPRDRVRAGLALAEHRHSKLVAELFQVLDHTRAARRNEVSPEAKLAVVLFDVHLLADAANRSHRIAILWTIVVLRVVRERDCANQHVCVFAATLALEEVAGPVS